ncbi:MAG: hypothetical protein AAB919_00825 [Patescibacteria group bacterium]|mgnify:CR=1 FL=1
MLNPFPDLLTYGIFAPTLLRVAAALVLGYAAYVQWHRRDELAAISFSFVGSGAWIVWVLILLGAASALGLLLGLYTQWAALVGGLLALKSTVWRGRYPRVFPLSHITSLLLLVICLSLLLTGAGAFAFDIAL